ncbi:Zn-ribbon domain-containing OB-fold protein [Nocardia goodfellowii]
MTTKRPLPVPDDLSAPYWAAAAQHTLAIARCHRCATYAIPPDHTCTHCGTTDPAFRFVPVTGSGRIRSWTVVRRASLLGFSDQVPYLLVDVELAEQAGLRMIGRLLDGPEVAVHEGDPVRVAFEDVTEDVAIPAFRLSGGEPS